MSDEPQEMHFGGEVDLHHFAPEDTEFLVKALIDEAERDGLTRIRIVHGKGRSAKKRRVRAVLEADPRIASFRDDGYNWGATIGEVSVSEKPGNKGRIPSEKAADTDTSVI